MRLIRKTAKSILRNVEYLQLPKEAREETRRDLHGFSGNDPGPDAVIDAGIKWICRAQDRSTSNDGGVAHSYNLKSGWTSSYPETTGYIVPTLLDRAAADNDRSLLSRSKRMLDWLVSIELAGGSFPGGMIGEAPKIPVAFNTGQILFGLVRGGSVFGEPYLGVARRTADWLLAAQDSDGCWRRFSSPFAGAGEHTYDVHIAWAMIDVSNALDDGGYLAAAASNVSWALRFQQGNGWFANCCLDNPGAPLTHTIGYTLRGLVEACLATGDTRIQRSAELLAKGVMSAIAEDGALPGRLDGDWKAACDWTCLTGSSQIAHALLLLYQHTNDRSYFDGATKLNRYVRRTIRLDGTPDTAGAVKGSFPIWGAYGPYSYLNWACKFTIDANVIEQRVRAEQP